MSTPSSSPTTERTPEEVREFFGMDENTDIAASSVVDLSVAFRNIEQLLPFYLKGLSEENVCSPATAIFSGLKIGMGLILEQFNVTGDDNPASDFLGELSRRATETVQHSRPVN